MILSWLSRLVASLLTATLLSLTVTTVLNSTVFSSKYVEQQLTKTNSYDRLSKVFANQVTQKSGQADPNVQAQLGTIITPDVLRQKINQGLDQSETYYKGNGPAPTIDMSDIVTKLQAAGIPVDPNSYINKPIPLSTNSQAKHTINLFLLIKNITLIATIILAILLLFLSWKRARFTALASVLISVGVFVGLLALLLAFAPSVLNHILKFNGDSTALTSIFHDLASNIAHDLGLRFGIIAALYLLVGIVGRILLARRNQQKSVYRAKTANLPR